MLNIDNKVYRTIQEQVAWLSTTVAEIIKITDVETLDEYIKQMGTWSGQMEDWSGTMEDYATTMGGYATTMGGYANEMAGWRNEVSTWTNNINAAAVSAINASDIAPLTVRQTNANFTANNSVTGVLSNFSATDIYNRVHLINRSLMFIINEKITNNSGSDKAVSNGELLLSGDCGYIPLAYRELIIDFDGKYLGESGASNTIIATALGTISLGKNWSAVSYPVILVFYNNTLGERRFTYRIFSRASFTIPNTDSAYISVRNWLFI